MEEQEIKTPKPKGGKREGAGRKPYDGAGHPTMLVAAKLRIDYVALIDNNHDGSRSDFIQKAVKEKLYREGLI